MVLEFGVLELVDRADRAPATRPMSWPPNWRPCSVTRPPWSAHAPTSTILRPAAFSPSRGSLPVCAEGRPNALAKAQTQSVVAQLNQVAPGLPVEIVKIQTAADLWTGDLSLLGGKGNFTKEIDRALISGRIDLAVHSMKDVPGDVPLPKGTEFGAYLPRGDVHDVVISRDGRRLANLPAGAKAGTSSVRRRAQLSLYRPNLRVERIRSGIDSRIENLDAGEFDASNGWEAELGDQVGAAAEDDDAGDARVGHGENTDSERAMEAVAVAIVGGRGGLTVGEGRNHPPVPRGPDDVREVAQAGHAAGEPGTGPDHLDRDVGAQRPFQGCGVGVLEAGDVLVEQRTDVRRGGLADLLSCWVHLIEAGAGPLQRALDRRDRGVEHGRDLGSREGQHLPQDEHGPLPGGQILQAGDEREPQALA